MEKISEKTNSLNWFEIPVKDTKRAKQFYEHIFNIKMQTQETMGMEMTMFPWEPGAGKVSGALVKGQMHIPGKDGPVLYLNANPHLQTVVDKIEAAGGKVVMPKTQISEDIGYMAFFIDTEGNRIALHARK
ncbi:VOC family protein [Chitinophaga vietnamensis]|uniref:VOC family protein n=1 Tax=Chitinophaga vietnamensis TaxID=2593957 RepID=UPI00117862D2|nr:VOC family protein [Chitinophaga vietnamensis]